MTCADYPWLEDEALAAEHFATGTEAELRDDYWDLWRRVNRWRHRHAPTAHHLEAGHPIPGPMVEKARKSLDTCLRAYKRLPLTLLRDAAQMEEVAIGFELLGVKGGEV